MFVHTDVNSFIHVNSHFEVKTLSFKAIIGNKVAVFKWWRTYAKFIEKG